MKASKTFISSLIFIVIITTMSTLYSFGVFDSSTYIAKNGVLSLQNWHQQENPTIELNGEWEFYPNELIIPLPNENVFDRYKNKQTIPVPQKWDTYIADEETPFGIGTYRLVIQLPKDDRYALKLNTIRNANKVFLNQREAGGAGVPSSNKETYQYSFDKYVAFGESNNQLMEVVIHVANQEYRRGGIVQSVHFGQVDSILRQQSIARLIEALLIAGYLLFAIFYAGIYFQSKNYMYELFFSLFCFAQAIYVSTVNERWLTILLPTITPQTQVDIQMASMSCVFLFFILFIYRFFEIVQNKKILQLLCTVLIVEASIFVTETALPNTLQLLSLPTKQTVVVMTALVCYTYIFILLMKAFQKKNNESVYILIIVITFLLHGLLLALEFLYEIAISNTLLFLYLVIVFSLAFLMKYRLQQAIQQAEELSENLLVHDQLKNNFLLKTSHEIGTPLHGIINLSQTLIEGAEGPLRKSQQESLLLIHNVGKRLSRIVEDLLFISEIKEEQIRLQAKPISINIVDEIIAEATYLIPASHSVLLLNKIPKEMPLIYMDEQRLKQVLFNLIHNAIKYTPQGTVTITASLRAETMHINVTDTGKGIPDEHKNLIFLSFYQVDHDQLTSKDGLGLGLSISKKIIEQSGGQIWFSSEVGKGSCFTFTVPLAKNEQLSTLSSNDSLTNEQPSNAIIQPVTELLATRVVGTEPYTILIVDDELSNIKLLMNMIQSLHYNAIAVQSGEEALCIIQEEKIDLILLDLMMPDMSGFDVCQTIREKHDLIELPIIILTAAKQLSDIVLSFQLGANDFLQKPINLKELKARIHSLLMMKQSAHEMVQQELSFYHAQIKPHFLYNTLNSIIALSHTDEEKTRNALEQLAIYFRAKLNFQHAHTVVPLEDELELLEAYLSIEQLRFGNRLTIVYTIDEALQMHTNIPFMTLQPLAENAIQHGLMTRKEGGTLHITLMQHTQYIKIIIEDNGVGMSLEKQQQLVSESNKRIGFINPLKKIALIKGASFEFESTEGVGTKITILLPNEN